MKTVTKKLSQLRPLEKNVRKHNDKQISEYVRSLKMFGQLRPMVVDETGTILVGNGMYEAMKRIEWESADCIVREGLTEKQKIKLMMADNRVYELGMTDMDAFEELVRSLGDDIDVPGWDEDLLQTITSTINEADAIVESYGLFDSEEVSHMNERQREDHTALAGQEIPKQPLQRPEGSLDAGEPVSDRAAPPPPTAAAQTLAARYIICPHCGQRINLDEIGGM